MEEMALLRQQLEEVEKTTKLLMDKDVIVTFEVGSDQKTVSVSALKHFEISVKGERKVVETL